MTKFYRLFVVAILTMGLPISATYAQTKQPKLTIVQGEAPASSGLGMQNLVIEELRKGYDEINIISVSNCDKAAQVYNSITDTPVVYIHTSEYQWLKEAGMHTCGVKMTPENIWMNVEMAQGFCTKGPGPVTFEDFKKSKTFGSIVPFSLTDTMVDQINRELKTDIKKIPYNGGSGLALTGILNGEIDYAPIALFRVLDMMEDKRVACFAKYGQSNDKLPSIRNFIPGFSLGDYVWNVAGAAKNMNAEQLKYLRDLHQASLKKSTVLRNSLDKGMWDVAQGDEKELWRRYKIQEDIFVSSLAAAKK
jgi:hypothetical protein